MVVPRHTLLFELDIDRKPIWLECTWENLPKQALLLLA
jgi:hypothetical protein